MPHRRPAGDYGTDAPWVPWLWFGFGFAYLVAGTVIAVVGGELSTVLWFVVLGAVLVAGGALYVHATRRGKFQVWGELLDDLDGTPPRTVLDIGCGRGAVAIATALKFPHAQVTGIDLWRSIDQSGNDPSATTANAQANGVQDRLTLVTANMTDLPLPDAAYDLVTASLSIHNVKSADGRRAAVEQAWRCLSPGGRLVIVDLPRIREYVPVLSALTGHPVTPRGIGWRMWWSGPWMRTQVISMTKDR